MKRTLLVFLCLILVVLLVSPAFAAPKVGFVVKNGQWQRRSGGKDAGGPIEFAPRLENGMDIYGDYFLNGKAETEEGVVFWLAVQSGNDVPDYQFGPTGLHFYSEKTKKYSFLPTAEDDGFGTHISSVEFRGDKFLVAGIDAAALYTFPELQRVMDTDGAAHWVDNMRFVFCKPDPILYSAYLFDTRTGETSVLKKAEKTSSFLTGIYEPGYISGREDEILAEGSENVINVTELFVKSEEDLEDFWGNCEARYLTIELPAL